MRLPVVGRLTWWKVAIAAGLLYVAYRATKKGSMSLSLGPVELLPDPTTRGTMAP